MEGKSMRDRIVSGLNDLLDVDHDAVASTLLSEYDVSSESMLINCPLAYKSKGVDVITGLGLLSAILEGAPITPVFEGDVIQRFE